MKIQIGDYDVLESGTIISVIDEPLDFILTEEPNELKLRFLFRNDENDKNMRIENSVENDSTLTLIFVNFNNPIGSGSTSPLEVGVLDNRKLYLSYRIYAITENTAKHIHYTWLLGGVMNNG